MKILTDKEYRLFLSAMNREMEICKKTDKEFNGGINLVNICNGIVEKVNNAEPVRHGYWIKEKIVTQTTAGIQLVTWAYVCSECKMRLSIIETKKNYCPYCGAKMDKEEQDE